MNNNNNNNKRRAEDASVVPARTARTRTGPVREVDPVVALVSMRRASPVSGGAPAPPPPSSVERRGPVRESVDLTDDDGVVIPDEYDDAPLSEGDMERARAEASEGVEMGKHICGNCLYPTLVDDLESCRRCGLVYCPMCMPLRVSCAHETNVIYCDMCASCKACEPDIRAQMRARREREVVCVSSGCTNKVSALRFNEFGWHVCHGCTFAVCENCTRACKHAYPLCPECECAACRGGN